MKKHSILLLKIILSAALLAYLLSKIPLDKIIDSAFSANPVLLLSGLFLVIPIIYLSAFETRYLTRIQGIDLSTFEIIKIHLATSFYGLFLPGIISAGAVKWYKFSKYGGKSAAAAVVVFNRFLEILMTAFIGILFSLPVLYTIGDQKFFFMMILLVVLMIAFYVILFKKSEFNFPEKILLFIPLPAFLKNTARKFSGSMRQFNNLRLKDHLEIFGLLFLYHGIGIFSFLCFANSLNIDLSIWQIGWIRSAMALAIMLPLSFAGLGIREGTLVFILGYYGIQSDVSMALSFLFFSRNILTSAAGGMIELKDFIISKNYS
jgi:uncharacterized protein (TIRG00374 family)